MMRAAVGFGAPFAIAGKSRRMEKKLRFSADLRGSLADEEEPVDGCSDERGGRLERKEERRKEQSGRWSVEKLSYTGACNVYREDLLAIMCAVCGESQAIGPDHLLDEASLARLAPASVPVLSNL